MPKGARTPSADWVPTSDTKRKPPTRSIASFGARGLTTNPSRCDTRCVCGAFELHLLEHSCLRHYQEEGKSRRRKRWLISKIIIMIIIINTIIIVVSNNIVIIIIIRIITPGPPRPSWINPWPPRRATRGGGQCRVEHVNMGVDSMSPIPLLDRSRDAPGRLLESPRPPLRALFQLLGEAHSGWPKLEAVQGGADPPQGPCNSNHKAHATATPGY